jgi:hypothetical protein
MGGIKRHRNDPIYKPVSIAQYPYEIVDPFLLSNVETTPQKTDTVATSTLVRLTNQSA